MKTQTLPSEEITTLEQPMPSSGSPRRLTLGLPSGMKFGERRFPVTPEGASQLSDRNILLKMERGAGEPIHYSDAAYSRAGADICSRAEALAADVVVTPAPLHPAEARSMRRGALLVTLLHSVLDNPAYARSLRDAGVNVVAADLICHRGHRLVADILHEIDGCASLSIASSLLTDPIHGKGILLGGVTGIVPCEVTALGSGMGAIAAAHNALGLGATVRMFDDDLYSLRSASRVLDHRAIASAMHPKVLHSALRSADVVVVTPMAAPMVIEPEYAAEMKRRVIIFDLTCDPGATFPSVPTVNLAAPSISTLSAAAERACYFNVGCRVPRTAAMALSNALVANVDALRDACGTLAQMPAPMRPALLYFWGKCVNQQVAEATSDRALDINLLIGN